MKLPVWLAGAGAMVAGCGNGSGEDDWRLNESRSIVANNDELRGGLAVSVAAGEFRIPVPVGVERGRIALGAVGKLAVGRGARVFEPGSVDFGTMSGLDGVDVGVEAQVGSIYNVGKTSVVVGDNAVVHGFIRSAAEVRRAVSAQVDQGIIDNASTQTEEFRWHVKFPEGSWSDSTAHVADAAPLDLKPGSYGTVLVEAGATAVIHSGAYYIRSLQIEPGAIVEIDNSYGPVYVWVREALTLRGVMMEYEAKSSNVLFGYAGTAAPSIGAGFRGTLVAPAADVALPAGGAGYVGSVFAREVRMADGALFEHRAFESADADYAAAPDYGSCAQDCHTVFNTASNGCYAVFNAAMNTCTSTHNGCMAAGLITCTRFGMTPALVVCVAAISASCGGVVSSCYNSAGAAHSSCQNNASAQSIQCGHRC